MPPWVLLRVRNIRERNDFVFIAGVVSLWLLEPKRVKNGRGQVTARREVDPANTELGCEVVGPAQEHVGDDSHGR